MKRAKTPKQIYKQAMRIVQAIAEKHWNGKIYLNREDMCAKMDKITATYRSYVANIYNYNGVDEYKSSAEESNRIWNFAKTPVSIYTKNY